MERDAIERAAAAEADNIVDIWDDYFEDACRRADVLHAYDNVLRRT